MGQMLWYAVAKDEKGGYGKNMKNLRLRPVILSVVTYEDIQKRAKGVSLKEIRKCGEARILHEADKQSGTLAQSDLSLILSRSLATIQKEITDYERENNVVLPRRGTVHDLGRSTAIPGLLFCFHLSCLKLYRQSSLIFLVTWRVEACNIIKCLRNDK